MNTLTPVQAALAAIAAQAGALAVGYGLVSNAAEGKWIALTMAIVNGAGVIAHALHASSRDQTPTPAPPPAPATAPVATGTATMPQAAATQADPPPWVPQ